MSPEEFVTNLSANYAKRHESPDAKRIWMNDIIAVVKGHGPKVLKKAYEHIRDTHEERAFPLPATIKKAIEAAAGIGSIQSSELSPELQARFDAIRASRRRPPTPEEIAAEQKANAWQHEMMAKYNNDWGAYYRATRGADQTGGKPKRAQKLGDVLPPITTRAAFEKMQTESPNAGAHMTAQGLTERSKAMTGERDE